MRCSVSARGSCKPPRSCSSISLPRNWCGGDLGACPGPRATTVRSSPRGGAPDDRKRKRAQVRSILHQQPVATRLMMGSCPEPTAEQAVEACCASVSRAIGYVPARLTHVPSEARWGEGGARCRAVLAPNGSRLSCGRLARQRFPLKRSAPGSFKRLLGGHCRVLRGPRTL